MKTIISRIIYGTLFAIPLMLLTYAFAQASPQLEADLQDEVPVEQDCKTCHPAFYETWEDGPHGQAFDDPAFQKAWRDAGSTVECLVCHVTGYDSTDRTWESDGVTCQRCHNPITENHPAEPMPVSRSSELCAECHTETSFQWGASVHAQNDLGCETCHDPHGSQLAGGRWFRLMCFLPQGSFIEFLPLCSQPARDSMYRLPHVQLAGAGCPDAW